MSDLLDQPTLQNPAAEGADTYRPVFTGLQQSYDPEISKWNAAFQDPENNGGMTPNAITTSKVEENPQDFRDLSMNINGLSYITGRPSGEIGLDYEQAKQDFVKRQGWDMPKTEAQFRSQLGGHIESIYNKHEAVNELFGDTVMKALEDTDYGNHRGIADFPTDLTSVWKQKHAPLIPDQKERDAFDAQSRSVYLKTLTDVAPIRKEIATSLKVLNDFTTGKAGEEDIQKLGAMFKDMPADKMDKILSYVSVAADRQHLDKKVAKGFLQNLGESISRGADFAGDSFSQSDLLAMDRINKDIEAGKPIYLLGVNGDDTKNIKWSNVETPNAVLTAIAGDAINHKATPEQVAVLKEQITNHIKSAKIGAKLKQFSQTSIDPITPLSKAGTWARTFEQMAYDVGSSAAPMGAVAINPVLGFEAYKTMHFNDLLVKNQDKDLQSLNIIASVEGALEAVGDMIEIRVLKGVMPKLIDNYVKKFGNKVVRALLRAGEAVGFEYAVETGQDAIPALVEGAANAMGADIEQTGTWEDFNVFEARRFWAVAFMGGVGAGVATFRDLKDPRRQMNRTMMGYNGVHGAQAEYVLASESAEEADARWQEVYSERTEANIAKGEELLVKDSIKAQEKDGTKDTYTAERNAAGEVEWVVLDYTGKEVGRVGSEEAAKSLMSDRIAAKIKSDENTVYDLIDWWKSQDSTNTATIEAPKTVQQELDRMRSIGDTAGIKNLHERIAFAVQAGDIAPDADLNKVNILGGAKLETTAEGVFRGVISLSENAKPEDAFEEINHVFVKKALAEGRVTMAQLQSWIAQTEKATGTKYARESETDVMENIAKIGWDYASGRIDESAMPASFVDYVKRTLAVLKEVMVRALKLKDAFATGKIDQEFESFLAESVGLDPQIMFEKESDKVADEIKGDAGNTAYSLRQQDNWISKVNSDADHLRVGTAKLGTAAKQVDTPNSSNISGEIVPETLLAKQLAKVDYAHLPKSIRDEKDPTKKRKKLINWFKKNLEALYNAFPEEYRSRATHWYDGANRIAKDLGNRFDATVEQASAVLAVFSPQKDWFMNVAQGEQFMEIWHKYQDVVLTEEMVREELEQIINVAQAPAKQKRKQVAGETAEQKAERKSYNDSLDEDARNKRRQAVEQMIGKSIRDLDADPYVQGWAIRTFAQIHFGRNYQNISPEGDRIGIATNDNGTPSKNGWGSVNEIEKAVRIMKDGSLANISENLGNEHKVRNFYNNIVAPNNPFGDATIDTHAVAAAHIMPFGASATEVQHNFGTGKISSSDPIGVSGVYHLYLDAYKELANELGILPRQLQSITWEAIRLVYPAAMKNKESLASASRTWENNSDAKARQELVGRDIPIPVWGRTDNASESESIAGTTGEKGNLDESGGSLRVRDRSSTGGGSSYSIRSAGDIRDEIARIAERDGSTIRLAKGSSLLDGGSSQDGGRVNLGAVTPAEFSQIAAANKAAHKFGSSVDVYSADDYQDHQLILVEKDGETCTLSISSSGELGSATKSMGGSPKLIDTAFDAAIATGTVRWLNAFDTILPSRYAPKGFEAVARLKFDEKYMPEGWDFNAYKDFNNGRPDVVFMRRNPNAPAYQAGDGKYVADYDEASRLAQQPSDSEGEISYSIRDGSKEGIGININDGEQDFTDQILRGEKTIETRNSRSLDPYIGKRVGLVSTGKGKAQHVGFAVIGEPKFYADSEAFRQDEGKHLVQAGSEYDIPATGKWGYPINEVEKIEPRDVLGNGIVGRKVAFSIRSQEQIDSVAQAMMQSKMFPEGNLAIYERAKQRFASVLEKNRDVILGMEAAGASALKIRNEKLKQALIELDGILKTLPYEVRGRVGGMSVLANIGTGDKALADFFKKRVEMLDKELEKYLSKEYDDATYKFLKTTLPKKREAGEKPKGIGADLHAMFAVVREAMGWSEGEVNAHIAKIDYRIDNENLTPEEEARLTREADLVASVGNWKNKPSMQKGFALKQLITTWSRGYQKFLTQKVVEKQERDADRSAAIANTGKAGLYAERQQENIKQNGKIGILKKSYFALTSWDQFVSVLFGEKSDTATFLADGERHASNTKEDRTQAKLDEVADLFTRLAGTRLAGEQLRWEMSQKSIAPFQGTPWTGLEFSQLEALSVTMLWMQEDGKRHMIGKLDDVGNPISAWHYNQDFVDTIEKSLSKEAKEVRAFLLDKYAKGYDDINKVYTDLNGVNLPQIKNYSPVTVAPINAPKGMSNDPVTGAVISGMSSSPSALRTRGTSISEPNFRDVLQTYLAHTRQMEHWMAYAPFMHQANGILRNRDVQNAIEAKGGEEARKMINAHLDIMDKGGVRDASAQLGLNQAFSKVGGRAAQIALVGRISTILLQSTQLGASLAEMPTGAYILRMSKLLSGNLGWGEALKSPYIQRRLNEMPPIVRQAMEGLQSDRPNVLKHTVEKLGRLISGADAIFTAGTYAITYDYHLKQAKEMGIPSPEEYAHRTAERAVDKLAQPTRMGARSIFENTQTGPFAKLGWAFASESRKNLALAAYNTMEKPAGTKARTLFSLLILNSLAGTLIRNAWKDAKDDDDNEWFDEKHWSPKRLALAAMTDPLQGFPIIGDAVKAAAYKVTGEYLPSDNLFSMNNVAGIFSHVPKYANGSADWEMAIKDLDHLVSGMGMWNANIAAVSSLTHLASDMFGLTKNTVKAAK